VMAISFWCRRTGPAPLIGAAHRSVIFVQLPISRDRSLAGGRTDTLWVELFGLLANELHYSIQEYCHMKKLLFSAIPVLAIAIAPAIAKTEHRKATFTSNVAAESGQCTVEVVVPGAARVRVEGDEATLQRMSGRSPEWRRFECTSPLPEKPEAFRVETTGGRGHQEMVHGPRHHGGSAVDYIDDSKHGDDTYSFNLVWGGAPAKQ